eukprot:4777966-Alexandrium_andersonii.AAC.1
MRVQAHDFPPALNARPTLGILAAQHEVGARSARSGRRGQGKASQRRMTVRSCIRRSGPTAGCSIKEAG